MKPKPDSLFKFYSFSLLSLKTVGNDFLWFSRPSTFNDPYDCAIAERDNINSLENIIDAENGNPQFKKLRSFSDQLKNIGVCCFTLDPQNIGMWSHYAGQHTGFCVEYDCSEGSELRKVVEAVIYSDKRVSLDDYPNGADELLSLERFKESWLVKALDWKLEKEWRVAKPEGGRLYRNLSQVKSIIFGARMLRDDMELLRKCMRHKQKIKYKRASLVHDSFLIKIQDYVTEHL